jgi:hypothetical protein
MTPRIAVCLLAPCLGFTFVGCPGELENPERFGPATCPAPLDVPTAIFLRSCADRLCHDSTEPAAELDLSGSDVLDQLIDVPSSQCADWLRIDSELPEESLLLEKLEETFPSCGDRMPLGERLPATELACVRDWVFSVVGKGDAGGLPDASDDASTDGPAAEASE